MRRFRTDDLLVSVLPVKQAAKRFPGLRPKDGECTPYPTNPTDLNPSARVSRKDLAVLRRLLAALQNQ